MPFQFKRENNDLVVYISGSLTFHQHQEGEQLVHQITTLIKEGHATAVRLNFADVKRMDSHWLGVLIRLLRRVQENGASFAIEKPSEDVNRLFQMVEFGRIAEIRN